MAAHETFYEKTNHENMPARVGWEKTRQFMRSNRSMRTSV